MPDGEVNKVDKAVNSFNKKNGNLKEFSTKEVMIILHKEQQAEIRKCHSSIADVKKDLERHIDWGQTQLKDGMKILGDHDKLFEKMMNTLPEKGFCENVTNALWPKNQPTLAAKVEDVWHQRRYIKGIFITLLAIFGAEIVRFIL